MDTRNDGRPVATAKLWRLAQGTAALAHRLESCESQVLTTHTMARTLNKMLSDVLGPELFEHVCRHALESKDRLVN